MDEKVIEFNKGISEFKRKSRIKECFYHKKEECEGDIKQSHSIQKNGRLSILEEEVNGNNSIYTFTSFTTSANRFVETLDPIGKSKASTFFGFCDHHDTKLFSDIENFEFDESNKHLFLHSYRSFAHSYHRKHEELRWLESDSEIIDKMPGPILGQRKKGVQMGIQDMNSKKKNLDELIENEKYNGLSYLYDEFPNAYPIACSTAITPDYTYSGIPFNNHTDPDKKFSPILLTVLPDKNSTIVILACFPDDELAMIFLDELDDLYPHHFKKAITSLMITYAENTFFSPSFWKSLGKKKQRTLLDEIEENQSTLWEEFRMSELNFFEIKNSINRLEANT